MSDNPQGSSIGSEGAAPSPHPQLTADDLESVKQIKNAFDTIKSELGKVIVGQEAVIDQLLVCIFSRGHSLLIGVPGLAKTLLISTLARTLSLSFSRIQFTPDLMPADITGTEVIQEDKSTGQRHFTFLRGPIFANVILADEINRTPPKTQAALLESMQEHQVTAGGRRHKLDEPFFVLATQNPIEQEGTYPLPEAQLDRFMFMIKVDYPSWNEEIEVVRKTTANLELEVSPVLGGTEILDLQKLVRKVPIADDVLEYGLKIVRSTRLHQPETPDFINEWVSWGAGPRAAQYLTLGAKARALLHGRHFVNYEDIERVAYPVLRHRILTNFSAEAEGITPDRVIDRLLETISPQGGALVGDQKLPPVVAKD